MHEYYAIKTKLAGVFEAAGFEETSEQIQPDVFGSAYSTFACATGKYRIVWDGKDGYGRVDKSSEDGWVAVGTPVPESRESEFRQAINALVGAVSNDLKTTTEPPN